jgi:peptidyl-prolyl cis-trans isomerase B (cyclophilin B)
VNEENASVSNIVVLETTKGNIEIELDFEKAPITSENFKEYVLSGYFEGLIFHRIIQGFMIQGGGFKPNGSPKETNDSIILESDNGLSNETGTIAMARTNDPNSATSQFFINTVDNDFLDYSSSNPGYAVFGKVVDGMDVVYEIEAIETTTKGGHQDWPKEDVVIIKAYFKE